MSQRRLSGWARFMLLVSMLIPAYMLPTQQTAQAAHTAAPGTVTLVGDLQSEAGCAGDWDPKCTATNLAYDATDGVWQATFTLPAGNYQYKVALNSDWAENYGAKGVAGGDNIALVLAAETTVKFYYSHESHWITENVNSRIVTAPGNFQDTLGCSGEWQPDCLRSWLQDVDGDGTYVFETTALPAGTYEGKAAIGEGWGENYGNGGVLNGPNIGFTVPTDGAKVTFRFISSTNTLSILAGHAVDGNVEWDGLRHDSRDTLYRSPGGAVPVGTPVLIRFRTFHNDVSSVKLRLYDLNANGQRIIPMTIAAANVPCYQAGLERESCDFWEAQVQADTPNNFWYRFIINDGETAAYYADNTAALDGGLGATTSTPVDQSYALMVYAGNFTAPRWAQNAVIYQIFPDRFRNGNSRNDPQTGDSRYDDPVIRLPWNTLSEGYCRNYTDAATNCPWRFDTTPPDWSPTKEQPRGRDYFGGDLRGVMQKLDYLQSMGVTVIYFNPIFWAKSNHRYDTYDYLQIDPALGTNRDFRQLVTMARERGIKIIVDSVFNHMSSDSPKFDRYQKYADVGACESLSSAFRSWFNFRNNNVPCTAADYVGWFGFDSIPEINKSNPAVQQYFLTAPNSVSRYWLQQGARGWRLDVMGDSSFPAGYWETFRQVVRGTDPEAVIIGELWQKDSTLLRNLRGETADTTMNYRMRDAILGLLAPQPFDSKGFADSGRQIQPSEFASRLASIREDYPDPAFFSLMNLMGSHDTERALWTLTPGTETRAAKEFNATNLAEGKRRLQLASLIQFALPGAPTVYYGDEVGVTGDDDPDDRRTYPWRETGGNPDKTLLKHYQELGSIRQNVQVLRNGDFRVLQVDDAAGTVALGRRNLESGAVLLINRSNTTRIMRVPVTGFAPNNATLDVIYCVGNDRYEPVMVINGFIEVSMSPLSGMLLASMTPFDWQAPVSAATLTVSSESAGSVALSWNSVSGAVGYNVYRSVVRGGGYLQINTSLVTGTTFSDTGLRNGDDFFYVVKAVDAVGNEGPASNEVRGTPQYLIGWANLQWPPEMTYTISAGTSTDTAYGQVWIDGATNQSGQTPSLRAQLGFGPTGSNPAGNSTWTWVDASFNGDVGNNDEFKASMQPEAPGTYDYLYRYSTNRGRTWLYADQNGPVASGALPAGPGRLTVIANADTTPPAAPTGLQVTGTSPSAINLSWTGVSGDTSMYGYEILRSNTAGGPYTRVGLVAGADTTTYRDSSVAENATYFYVVRAIDIGLNRSGNSNEVQATAEPRTVTLVINLTVPAPSGAAVGRSVYIAGFLSRLNGGLPDWNPGGVSLTQVSSTLWTITFTGLETTEIEYKYTLGSWDYVEKGAACDELANRRLTLSYGTTGTQVVNESVANWRNVAPCGN